MGEPSYLFYNDAGETIASISPNGVQQLKEGVSYSDIDKSTQEYANNGWLRVTTSKDEGRSEFVYRKDGTLRFSQNAVQREKGYFSYTAYDKWSRPIESGEYRNHQLKPSTVFSLDPLSGRDVHDILESEEAITNETLIGGLTRYRCYDVTRTFYDRKASSTVRENHEQEYLMGGVSYSEYQPTPNGEVTSRTYYSYDEFGMLDWTVRELQGLGKKTIDYTYDYFGNITEIAYQKGVFHEQFFHRYTYNTCPHQGRQTKASDQAGDKPRHRKSPAPFFLNRGNILNQ